MRLPPPMSALGPPNGRLSRRRLLQVMASSLAMRGVSPVRAAVPGEREGKLAGPTFFVLAVFIAPPQEMRKWRARGVNTILGVGENVNEDAHHAEAVALGLRQIRRPRESRIAEDLATPGVIAFETVDEPTNIVDGKPRETPDEVSAEQVGWRAAAKAAGVVQPVFTNHIGAHIWQAPSRIGLDLAEYHRRSDWLGSDTYQIAAGEGNLLTMDGRISTYQGQVLRLQREMAPEAPFLAFLQVSGYETGKAVPTPGELRAQIWSSVVNGASMLALFSVRLTPQFAWDVTPDDLVETIRTEFAAIASLEDILIDREKGGARPGQILACAPEGTPPAPDQLPWPFEARIIDYRGERHAIVLNLSDAPANLSRSDWRLAERRFAPHEVLHGVIEGR